MCKTCNICKIPKEFKEYHKYKKSKDGLQSRCKACEKIIRSKRYIRNKEKERENQINWYNSNRKENLQYSKNWFQDNKERIIKQRKVRRNSDSIIMFTHTIRSLISSSFSRNNQGFKKPKKTEELLGCTIQEFKDYIKSLFTEGMTFDNHGSCEKCWNIDHKIPISSGKREEDIVKLCHYTNLQPMWSRDNIRKSNKF